MPIREIRRYAKLVGHDTDAIEACELPDSYLNSPRPAADAVPR
jgi:hypothetical protein